MLGASESQGRREGPPPGVCDVVPHTKSCDDTEVGRAFSTAFVTSTSLRAGQSSLRTCSGDGGDVGHQPIDTGVVGWTDTKGHGDRHYNPSNIPKEDNHIELFDASPGDKTRRPSSSKGKASYRHLRCTDSTFRGVSNIKSVIETGLSSVQQEEERSLRVGLKELKTNPTDILRHTYVEIKPSRHVSAALRCHLVRGWKEQKAGHLEQVRVNIAQAIRAMVTESVIFRTGSGKKLAACPPQKLIVSQARLHSTLLYQALVHYRQAIAVDPESTQALFCKAVVSAQLGELFDALMVNISLTPSRHGMNTRRLKIDSLHVLCSQRPSSSGP